jgi:hypothetical protein
LRYEHLTQTEDEEKLGNPHIIRKFVWQKDAVATFDQKSVGVIIK